MKAFPIQNGSSSYHLGILRRLFLKSASRDTYRAYPCTASLGQCIPCALWQNSYLQQKYTIDIKPTIESTIVYGKAITTIRRYDRSIKGANDDVSRNRNAACPFGVATLGIFVPVLIATAR